MRTINLDHIAASPLLPEVKEAMIAAIQHDYANPSSAHKLGDEATDTLEEARESVARLINCKTPKEIIFTSGGTESVNHAIKGTALANMQKGRHIVSSNIEHNSVVRSLRRLQALDFKIASVSVDAKGRVNPDDVAKAITDETILVSIMHSNNETGTIQPIKEIAAITREKKIVFHTDAVDSVGVIPVDVQALGVNLLSFASNPYYGPTGVGGLYIRRGTKIFPILDGGIQEGSKRAGTENLTGIIGMGVAAKFARQDMESRIAHFTKLKKKLIQGLPDYVDEYIINGDQDNCLPHLLSMAVKYVEGESVVLRLDDENIATSTRSACASGSLRASHVLQSIGMEYADAQGTLVITVGIDNAEEDIDRFLTALREIVKDLRDISPLYKKQKITGD